ncbi:MAG: dockerin type I repeat-containing protein [Gaiellaceae bacterium]
MKIDPVTGNDVRTLPIFERTLTAVLTSFAILFLAHASAAQDACAGDINHDGMVTAADAEALMPLLFVDPLTLDSDTLIRADVNDDGALSSADLAAVLTLDGLPCPTPPATPTVTPTRMLTPVITPTPTFTRPPTPPPTPTCVVQQATLGATNGTLSETDCEQQFASRTRRADVYSITAAPGTAISATVSAVAPLVGYLAVLDPAGQFQRVDSNQPIQFTITSGRPYTILVTSDPTTPVQVGNYTLTLTSMPCPTPVAFSINSVHVFTLDGTECPEPGSPSVGTEREPTDVYTFTVTDVPKNLTITMQQQSVDDDISPALAILGPDGYEPVAQDDNVDCTAATGTLLCAQIRFLALQRGTYTILATGGGGTGRYAL